MALASTLGVGCASNAGQTASTTPLVDASAPVAQAPVPMANDLNSMTRAALADAARRAGVDMSALKVISAASVTWPNGSLGCPVPGRMYTMALVPGYRIRIQAGAEVLDYHAGRRGPPVVCPSGRATNAVPDSQI